MPSDSLCISPGSWTLQVPEQLPGFAYPWVRAAKIDMATAHEPYIVTRVEYKKSFYSMGRGRGRLFIHCSPGKHSVCINAKDLWSRLTTTRIHYRSQSRRTQPIYPRSPKQADLAWNTRLYSARCTLECCLKPPFWWRCFTVNTSTYYMNHSIHKAFDLLILCMRKK